MSSDDSILVEYRDNGIAIITLNVPEKLNALGQQEYFNLAVALREIAERDDIYITVLTGTGRYFSAYVSIPLPTNTIHPSPKKNQTNANHHPAAQTSPSVPPQQNPLPNPPANSG